MSGTTLLLQSLVEARRRGLVGPGDAEHELRHARAFATAMLGCLPALDLRPGAVLDLGSGGGLPGLVLAVDHAELSVTLVDARRRSVDFLAEAVEALGVADRVRVVHGRAERLARDPEMRGRSDVVTVRAIGPPAVAAELAAGFVRPGGVVAVSEPPGGGRWDQAALLELGCRLGPSAAHDGATVQILVREGPVPAGVPRRDGIPAKRPRW